jgi:hypothetical protein
VEESSPHVYQRIDTSGFEDWSFQFVDIASRDFLIGRIPIAEENSTLTRIGFRGILKEGTCDYRICEIVKSNFPIQKGGHLRVVVGKGRSRQGIRGTFEVLQANQEEKIL